MVSFSGCSRTWSASRKKRLTVASSPTSATTISPSAGRVLRADDDEVVRQDAGVLHRLAADAEQVLAVLAAGELGHLDVVLDVLLGEDRLARGDVAEQRQPDGVTTDFTDVCRAPAARSSSSIARGFDGSRRSRPTFSRLARCACTVDDEARPTALPMSRTVGG